MDLQADDSLEHPSVAPMPVRISLPAMTDGSETFRISITVPLFPVVVAQEFGGATEVDASGITLTEKGVEIQLKVRALRYEPENYHRARALLGLDYDLEGPAAVPALLALGRALEEIAREPRGQGERGPGVHTHRDEQALLLTECLVRLARGMSQRAAIREVLEHYATVIRHLPDDNAMLMRLRRYLGR